VEVGRFCYLRASESLSGSSRIWHRVRSADDPERGSSSASWHILSVQTTEPTCVQIVSSNMHRWLSPSNSFNDSRQPPTTRSISKNGGGAHGEPLLASRGTPARNRRRAAIFLAETQERHVGMCFDWKTPQGGHCSGLAFGSQQYHPFRPGDSA
jgi:hypothetical protein